MNIIEKIIQCHLEENRNSELLRITTDFTVIPDSSGKYILAQMEELGHWPDPATIAFSLDHHAPSHNVFVANLFQEIKKYAEIHEQFLFGEGEGICHQLMVERGLVRPGMIIIGAESNTCTYGAFGALGLGQGATNVALSATRHSIWLSNPKVIKISLSGTPLKPITSKDVAIFLVSKLKTLVHDDYVIEFHGSYVQSLGVSERMSLANMAMTIGALTCVMPLNLFTINYLTSIGVTDYPMHVADSDASYDQEVTFDVTNLDPYIASMERCDTLSLFVEQKVDKVVIGTCCNGRIEDLRIVASILKGKKIANSVELIIIPASRTVLSQAIRENLLIVLIDAGAIIMPCCCGICSAAFANTPANGETVLATTYSCIEGALGNTNSSILIGSPITAAYAALYGKISSSEVIACV